MSRKIDDFPIIWSEWPLQQDLVVKRWVVLCKVFGGGAFGGKM